MRWFRRGATLVHAMLLGSACGVTDADRPAVQVVTITPETLRLQTGETGVLDARVSDMDGNAVNGRSIVWTSANPDIASVSDRGVVRGVNPGTVDVAASADGVSGVARVTVTPQPARVASVRLTPGHLSLFVAAGADLVATAYDEGGRVITGRGIVWTTNNAGVAAVSQTGHVTGLLPGSATITAVIDGIAGYATVAVALVPVEKVTVKPSSVTIEAGKSTTLTAELTDAAGNTLSGRPVAWSSSDTRVATVAGNGVVSGIRRGTAVVTATVEGKLGTATVRVR